MGGNNYLIWSFSKIFQVGKQKKWIQHVQIRLSKLFADFVPHLPQGLLFSEILTSLLYEDVYGYENLSQNVRGYEHLSEIGCSYGH